MLALRVLWAYFFDKSTPFDTFINRLYPGHKESDKTPLPDNLNDAVDICKAHAAAKTGWPAGDIRLLLMLDEFAKVDGYAPKPIASNLLQHLCKAVDKDLSNLLPVVTALDALLTAEGATLSGCDLSWVELRTLSDQQTNALFEDVYTQLLSIPEPDTRRHNSIVLNMCLVEANGHARLLQKIYKYFKANLDLTSKLSFEAVAAHLIEFVTVLPLAGISAIALGLLGVPVAARLQLPEETTSIPHPTVNRLVLLGIYMNSVKPGSGLDQLNIRLSGFLIRKFLKSNAIVLPVEHFHRDTPAYSSSHSLVHWLNLILEKESEFASPPPRTSKSVVGTVDRWRGHAFEYFHCYSELILLNARAVCHPFLRTWEIVSERFVKASMCERYGRDILANRTQTDRHLFETPLLWPLAILEVNPRFRGFFRLCNDLRRACADAEFVPPVHMFENDMPGFDAAIVVRESKPNEASTKNAVWCLLLEMKHSLLNARNSLFKQELNQKASTMMREKFDFCLKEAGAVRLFYVIVAWRPSQLETWKPPPDFPFTVLILNRSLLAGFYTSLKPYASYFAGEKVLDFKVYSFGAVFHFKAVFSA